MIAPKDGIVVMAKKREAFAKGFAQGFAPWVFMVAPPHHKPAPQVSVRSAWIQTGHSLRSAIDAYGEGNKIEKVRTKQPVG